MPIPTEEERIGRLVGGRYRLTARLGRGGTGVVYAAEHTWTGRRVAVKILRPEFARDLSVTRRFLQEARAAATIDHPHVVGVFDMGTDTDGTVFMALELVNGQPLSTILAKEGTLSPDRALSLLLPVMDALQAAHDAGVVHRDIKPENVLVRPGSAPDGRPYPKLADFGMARMLESSWGRSTQTGVAVGTPLFMSPEQAHADDDVGPQSDVWSMGVLLYHCLSGRFPHESDSPAQLLLSIVGRTPTPLSAVHPGIPAPIDAVVMRALRRDLGERHGSMKAFRDALVEAASASGVAVAVTDPEPPSDPTLRQRISLPWSPDDWTPTALTAPPSATWRRLRERLLGRSIDDPAPPTPGAGVGRVVTRPHGWIPALAASALLAGGLVALFALVGSSPRLDASPGTGSPSETAGRIGRIVPGTPPRVPTGRPGTFGGDDVSAPPAPEVVAAPPQTLIEVPASDDERSPTPPPSAEPSPSTAATREGPPGRVEGPPPTSLPRREPRPTDPPREQRNRAEAAATETPGDPAVDPRFPDGLGATRPDPPPSPTDIVREW
jgi:serine/threonine-protein kinase